MNVGLPDFPKKGYLRKNVLLRKFTSMRSHKTKTKRKEKKMRLNFSKFFFGDLKFLSAALVIRSCQLKINKIKKISSKLLVNFSCQMLLSIE